MITPGRYKARIEEHSILTAGTGSEFVNLVLDIGGEAATAQIYLTEKARRMARAQLKACGFRVDEDSLASLNDNPTFLRGKVVDVEAFEEEYKGQTRLKIRILAGGDVSKKRLEEIQKGLRAMASDAQFGGPPPEEEDVPF